MQKKILERFFWYVKTDTQSEEDVENRYPSTEKQMNLGKLLVDEMKGMGLEDAVMDENGYVMATLPSNLTDDQACHVPVIGFLAHLDTSPEVSGTNIMPILHENYQGEDIVLPGDTTQVLRVKENPELKKYIGEDIVTSDGTTLLGADDKAGIAEIMTMIEYLRGHPEIKYGSIRIGFTPDEEVGQGTRFFDISKFGADYAYTVDGEKVGEVENESFNAFTAVLTIQGINMHPGYAKGKLVNAIRIAAEIIKAIENEPAPETTENREGYLHPYSIEGGVEKVVLKILLRDFKMEGIQEKTKQLNDILNKVKQKYDGASIGIEIRESYKNMRFKLEEDTRVVQYALEAVKRTGIKPALQIIRGGTDGARLCFEGLLTPNIFTGGMNFHSKLEWIPVNAMEIATMTLVNLVQIWTECSITSEIK